MGLAVLGLFEAPICAQETAGSKTMLLKPHSFRDPKSSNMVSHTVLVPERWEVSGGAHWLSPDAFSVLPSQFIRVRSPEGWQVEVGPSLASTDYIPSQMARDNLGASRPEPGQASAGYLVSPMPENLEAWKAIISSTIARKFAEATDIEVETLEVIPELNELYQKQLAPIIEANAQQNQAFEGFDTGITNIAGGVFLGADATFEIDGQRQRMLFLFGTYYVGIDSQVGRQLWWGIEPNVSFIAPQDQFEKALPTLFSIANSVREAPEWTKMKSDLAAQLNAITRQGFVERSRIMSESFAEINRMSMEGHAQRMASMDRVQESFVRMINEVQQFSVPGSQQSVELPIHYRHYFTNGRGEFLGTNDTQYDPNLDPALSDMTWTRLQEK